MIGTLEAAVLWRRLDVPGHDACRILRLADGFAIEGTAVFLHDGRPARLEYAAACDAGWVTRRGRVAGWLGNTSVVLEIEQRTPGEWTLDGEPVSGLDDCLDVDLGFTPATNVLPLRRLALAVGRGADAPAAWLDVAARTLSRLPQRYDREGEHRYRYEAPSVGYRGALEVTAAGVIRRYPDLWDVDALVEGPPQR